MHEVDYDDGHGMYLMDVAADGELLMVEFHLLCALVNHCDSGVPGLWPCGIRSLRSGHCG